MMEGVILRSASEPVRLSFLHAALSGAGVEAELQNVKVGVWRLVVRAEQISEARAVLRELAAGRGSGSA